MRSCSDCGEAGLEEGAAATVSVRIGQLIRQGWQWRWSRELFGRKENKRIDDGP